MFKLSFQRRRLAVLTQQKLLVLYLDPAHKGVNDVISFHKLFGQASLEIQKRKNKMNRLLLATLLSLARCSVSGKPASESVDVRYT